MLRKLPFFVLFLAVSASAFAGGNIKKYLKMMPLDRGMLYFIKPLDMNSSSKGVSINSDFTYPFFKDSLQSYVTMNFTITLDTPVIKFKHVSINQNNQETFGTDTTERFYSEPQGKVWVNRYSVRLKLADLLNYFKNAGNGSIDLLFDNRKVTIALPKKMRKSYSLIASTIEVGCQGGY